MTRTRPQVALYLLTTLTVPMLSAPVGAEEPAAVAAGRWVRVTVGREISGQDLETNGQPVRVAMPGTTLEGEVQTLGPEGLVLKGRGDGRRIVIPVGAIAGLDVRRRESKKAVGLLIGALGGGAIGYAVGLAARPTCGPYPMSSLDIGSPGAFDSLGCGLSRDLSAPGGAILGVLGGAVVGLVIAPGARWDKNVPVDHVQVSLGPTRGRGLGVSLSIGF